ncbi:hypothetical protein ACJ5N2_16915 [Aeromonas salmonicida]|uniref:hypothetical protein n=1 Tax=Aeromonas salmonicida TaxID=645 RepID=UPI0038BDB4EA
MFQYNHWESEVQVPDDATAFVYKVTTYNASEGFKYYVGYKNMSAHEKWMNYKTSSKIIKQIIKAGTHSVHFEIKEFFTTPQEAYDKERAVQLAYNILYNDRWHNKAIAASTHVTAIASGEKSGMFKGYWVTPKGTFASSIEASKADGISRCTIQNRCYTQYPGYCFIYASAEAKANETSAAALKPKWKPNPPPAPKPPKPPKEKKPRKKYKPRQKYKHKFVYDGVTYLSKDVFMEKVKVDHPTVTRSRMMALRKRGIPYDQWSTWIPEGCIPIGATQQQIEEIRKKVFHL